MTPLLHRWPVRTALLLAAPLLAAQAPMVPDEAFFKGDPKAIMLACAARAVELKPRNPHVLAQAGRIQLAAGERAKAEASFQAALPGDAESVRWTGQGWLESGETDKALGMLTHIPHMGLLAKDELRAGAVLLMDSGHAKEAEGVMRDLFTWDPGDWEDLAAYGRACLRQKHQDLAAAWYARAMGPRRKEGEFWAEIALSVEEQGVER